MYSHHDTEYQYGQPPHAMPPPPAPYLHSPDSQSSGSSSYSEGSPVQGDLAMGTPMATPCFPGQPSAGALEFQRQMALAHAQAQAQEMAKAQPPPAPQGDLSMSTPMASPCFPAQYGGGGLQEFQRQMAQAQAQPQFAAPMSVEEAQRIAFMQAHANAYHAWTQHLFQQPYANPYNIYSSHPYAMTPELIREAFNAHARAVASQQAQPHHPQAENTGKRARRSAFTSIQLGMLISRFKRSDSIHIAERRELSKLIGLTPDQIKIWFQNRRFKLRGEAKRARKIEEDEEEEKEQKDAMRDFREAVCMEGVTIEDLQLGDLPEADETY